MGTIFAESRAGAEGTVHPHGRGDNCCAITAIASWRGSPPRAWGQCRTTPAIFGVRRFTPTGVGTIGGSVVVVSVSAVHPHGRGDNSVAGRGFWVLYGSPPRAWGQFVVLRRQTTTRRFTPTGVGTITTPEFDLLHLSVHPHGRGDNIASTSGCCRCIGSPPRAWGQSARTPPRRRRTRFTPTGVGTMLG